MKLTARIKDSVKDTVGYAEATNKVSFLVGSSVAFGKAEVFFNDEIESLTEQVERYKKGYEEIRKDVKTLTNILIKYSDSI